MQIPLAALLNTLDPESLDRAPEGSVVTVGDDLRDALGAALELCYRTEISAWNWAKSRSSAEVIEGDDGDKFAVTYLGSVFTLTPSGKVYAPMTSNQTDWDVFRDQLWWEVLSAVAEDHGASIGLPDGDPGDSANVWVAWRVGAAGEALNHAHA